MRLKLLFEKEIFGSMRKLWLDIPELNFTYDLIDYIKRTLEIDFSIEIWLNDHFVHKNLKLLNFLKTSDILTIKLVKTDSTPTKIPEKKKSLKNQEDKKKSKNIRKELKKNPSNLEFQGKRIKFDSSGNIKEVENIIPALKILSPAEEFSKKKSEWKIKPIPKKNFCPNYAVPSLISTAVTVLPHELKTNDVVSFSTTDESVVKVWII